jgi:hypothetical protein
VEVVAVVEDSDEVEIIEEGKEVFVIGPTLKRQCLSKQVKQE